MQPTSVPVGTKFEGSARHVARQGLAVWLQSALLQGFAFNKNCTANGRSVMLTAEFI